MPLLLAGCSSLLPLSLPSPACCLQTSQLNNTYIFAAMMFLAPLLGTLAAGQSNRLSIGTQIMVRAELTASIYRKALRLRWVGGWVGGWVRCECANICDCKPSRHQPNC
jgi:hypothetical protein